MAAGLIGRCQRSKSVDRTLIIDFDHLSTGFCRKCSRFDATDPTRRFRDSIGALSHPRALRKERTPQIFPEDKTGTVVDFPRLICHPASRQLPTPMVRLRNTKFTLVQSQLFQLLSRFMAVSVPTALPCVVRADRSSSSVASSGAACCLLLTV